MILFSKLFSLFFLLLVLLGIPKAVFAEDPLGVWSNTTSLPYLLASHGSFSHANKVSVVGGSAVTGQSKFDVLTAISSADGSISSWTTTSLTPTGLIFHSLAKKDSYVYILGGREENPGSALAHVPKVFVGDVNNNGIVNSWTQLNSLPQATSVGGAVIVGQRIYYAGGFNDSGAQDEIYFADINPDGTLGSWTTSLVSLPEPLYGFGMVEHNNNLIVFGGYNGSVYRNKTYKASVNPDGTISAFTETSALPEAVYRSAYVKVGSTIISAGGYNGFAHLDKVYYANINPDGTLGSWQQSANNLPQALQAAAASYANGFMYVTGGFNGVYLNTVYYAPVNISEGIDFPVPLLKQTNPLWGGFTYDSADEWAPPEPTDIARWGCALTSAAMVFQYHKITKLPNGIDLNPGTLNVFLKNDINLDNTKDGYVYEGYVNWAELSNISKLTKPQNPGFTHDSLEFFAHDGQDNDLLQSDIDNGNPAILQVPGHFIVSNGYNNGAFSIKDPFYNRSSLSDYENGFLTMKRFIPANSDLSYIVVSTQDNIDIQLKNSLGNEIGTHTTEYPITNPETGTENGNPAKFIYFSKPTSGDYSILVTSSSITNYEVQILTYDNEGQHEKFVSSGIAGPTDGDNYSISFDKDNSDNSSSTQVVTFDSLIDDIKSLRSLHEIDFRNYLSLLTRANVAKKLSGKNITKKASIKILKAMDKRIFKTKGKGVSNNAYSILHNDIQALITSI